MLKTYVIDTNVLLHDPSALFKFEENHLVIPIFVLEEIDSFKLEMTERGRNARQVARSLDELRKLGSLAEGVGLKNGGHLRVYSPPSGRRGRNTDQDILQTALDIRDQNPDRLITFVTMDVNLRVRSDAAGLKTAAYENQSVQVESLFSGSVDIDVDEDTLSRFFHDGSITWIDDKLYANACVTLRCGSATGLGRYNAGHIQKLNLPESLVGLKPRNREQQFALDLLLDPKVSLVTLVGMAGTGKTLLALAAGLSQVLEGGYSKLLVSRPIMPMGKDIGYLPGTIEEKLDPWMKPIFDNLDFLLMSSKQGKAKRASVDRLFDDGQLQVEPLTYIRGRSLSSQFVIVDEAQNLTPHEVRTIVTRCGEGTKIVLTGDPFQIDNPYVDASSNGLSVTAKKLCGESIVGHIRMAKGERSALANVAASKL